MKTKEIFSILESQVPTTAYKLVSGWVYRKYHYEKRFSVHMREDLFIDNYESSVKEMNARENAHLVFQFLEENKINADYKSIYGSRYYTINGVSVRVSNHAFTSENHKDCSFNFCSYEKDGFENIIEELKKII